jgi:hypothetical protein
MAERRLQATLDIGLEHAELDCGGAGVERDEQVAAHAAASP